FYRAHETNLASPFLLYGSGDFHYLTALRLRRVGGPIVLVSFDNHPDWDVRPPRWCCCGWVSRALEFSAVRHFGVWGGGNWEGGRFTIADLLWAMGKLRSVAQIVAGDICGAFSEPVYARWKQRFASEMDHPKLTRPDSLRTREINQAAFEALWPTLAQ